MALDFPTTPSVNDEYTIGNKTYIWDGTAWNLKPVADTYVAQADIGTTVLAPNGDGSLLTNLPSGGIGEFIGTDSIAISHNNTVLQNVIGTGNYNIGLGDSALNALTYGNYNIALGKNALQATTHGSFNVVLGADCLKDDTSANYNVVIGYESARGDIGNDNICLGQAAGGYKGIVAENIFLGIKAGWQTQASNSIGIGAYALQGQSATPTSGNDNIAIGQDSLYNTTTGKLNIAIGGVETTDTTHVVGTLNSLTTGNYNIAMGYQAGVALTTGESNVCIGAYSGYGIGNVGSDNIAIGDYTLAANYTPGDSAKSGNIAIGFGAGYKLGDGNLGGENNVILGYNAGRNSIQGNACVYLGYEAGYNETASNKLHIANNQTESLIEGDFSGKTLTINGSVSSIGKLNSALTGTVSVTINTAAVTGVGTAFTTELNEGDAIKIGSETFTVLTITDNTNLTLDSNHTAGASGVIAYTDGNAFTVINGDSTTNVTIDKSGNIDAVSFTGDGSGLTNLPAGGGIGEFTGSNIRIDSTDSAGNDSMSGSYNTTLNINAGDSLTSGSNHVLIGGNAGTSLTTQQANVAIGQNAGRYSKADNNIGIGTSAGGGNSTTYIGSNNVNIGTSTGNALTSGEYNVLMGYQAGYDLTSGYDNVLIGKTAGHTLTTGQQNVLIGKEAGYLLTGIINVGIGKEALRNTTTANRNIAIGDEALRGHATTKLSGDYNIGLGYQTGYDLTTGEYNVLLGYRAGYDLTTGAYNVSAGFSSLELGVSVVHNVALGPFAGYRVLSDYNVAVGSRALYGSGYTTGDYNVAVGNYAGYNVTAGEANVLQGYKAGQNTTTGNRNVFQGQEAGYDVTTGSNNIAVGEAALKGDATSKATGNDNIAIGKDSLYSATTGKLNIAIGGVDTTDTTHVAGTLNALTTGNYNIAMGYDAGGTLTTGSTCIAIGKQALSLTATRDDTIAIGNSACKNGDQHQSVALGAYALEGPTSGTTYSYQNTAFGTYALPDITSGSRNTAAGYQSGLLLTTGSNNVLIGSSAGNALTTGADNTCIGQNSDAAATLSNQTAIGHDATCTAANQITLGDASVSNFRVPGLGIDWDYDPTRRKPFVTKTTTYTAIAGDLIMADTATTGAFTLTLLSSPIAGDLVKIHDVKGNFATANLTVGRSQKTLTGSIDPTASTSVVGVGTAFDTELVVGDHILVSGEEREVATITDATNLTVTVAFSDNVNDTAPKKLVPIMGLHEDLVLNTNYQNLELLYTNDTDGWRII